jgi:signal transduction histidine kinase
MRRLLEEATAMQRLIRDLLYVARGDTGLPIAHEVDLDDLALAATAEIRSTAGVHIDTTRISAARVKGDERALARAVTNLLENAVRHARAEVAISTTSSDGWCELAVEDDGAGIAPADRTRVFDRFTRLDEARSRDDGGVGLGLAIVRDIAERHGGTATASESRLGGARVAMTIPSAEEERPT